MFQVRRNQTGVEMAQSITDLYRTRPNTEWLDFFLKLDVPDYYTTWAALISTLLTLLLPQSLVVPVALALASAFGVDDKSVEFLERLKIMIQVFLIVIFILGSTFHKLRMHLGKRIYQCSRSINYFPMQLRWSRKWYLLSSFKSKLFLLSS